MTYSTPTCFIQVRITLSLIIPQTGVSLHTSMFLVVRKPPFHFLLLQQFARLETTSDSLSGTGFC